MASKALKGLTIKIGGDTSELLDSLKDVEKRGKSLSGELGQINKLLKMDPKNTDLLAQKQKVLAEAISNTKDKLGTLKEAEKQAQEQFEKGEISEAQYRALQREIIATESKLNSYERAVEETAEAEKRLADSADDAAKELDDQADKTRKADDAADDLDSSADGLAAGGLAAMAAAAAAAVTAIVALAEESREYRNEMAKLDTAFTQAGHSSETAVKVYEDLQSVLGETDQAVEASAMLAKLTDNEEELAELTESLTGVYSVFGNSLPIEGLAEAALETRNVSKVTGPFADAINWAAEQGVNWKDVLGDNTKALKAFEKGVKDGEAVEDAYTLALEACSDEQERQKLITTTLTKLYGNAGKQFKKTNKEVIAANQATEKWNKATAKIGKTVEPVITDMKELGVTLLDDVEEPLEGIAKYIQSDVLPAIKDVSSWVKKNGPIIKTTLVGITTALVAYKTAVIATEVAHKGLKGAIMATTVAQKALDLVMKSSPWGLVATLVVAAGAALAAYIITAETAAEKVDILTQEERELMAAADEAAASFRDQKAATDESLRSITAQMEYTSELVDELDALADASGKVKEKDEARVQFILNELNEALGTEYQLVDGVISKYKDLKKSIDDVIQSKLVEALLEAANADYVTATQNKDQALENLTLKHKDYQHQLEVTNQKELEEKEAWDEYNQAVFEGNEQAATGLRFVAQAASLAVDKEKGILEEKKKAYDDSLVAYQGYFDTVANYEEAQTAALSGNYDRAEEILAKKGGAYVDFSDKVDEETSKVVNSLYKEAINAGLEAERTKRNFENGVDGYTKKMVTEADKAYKDAMDEFANAYADAEGVGEDLGDGLSGGMENKRSGLLAKAKSLVTGIISAMREEADSHSPAHKTIDFGEDVGEGAEIGIERKTKDVKRAATNQAAAMLEGYSEQEVKAQRTLRNLSEQQTARYTSEQMSAATANLGILEEILWAIKDGKLITIDGDTLVGATANKMDSALGRRRALASRGAI